jgi:putative ABC transport system permease protein
MKLNDIIVFSFSGLRGNRARTALTLLAMAIGVAAVVVLTSLGEAARRYVTGEFASLGTHLVIVLPGRTETAGAGPSMMVGETTRDLTIEDALALTRNPAVRRIAPINVGSAPVSWHGLEREVAILGSTSDMLEIRHWEMSRGRFLPPEDPSRASSVCVIGTKVKQELFGNQQALGEWVRIGERRFRVIGILATKGRSIGVDVQDLVIIPVAAAQMLFNTPSLFRILVEVRSREEIPRVKDFVTNTLRKRHQGEEDVTVITQDAVLATFDKIFRALTLTVAGIAAISLAVAGILIMNVMLISVAQRTTEIGLLKALGASRKVIITVFITEAGMLSLLGALAGLAIGEAGSWVLGKIYPVLPLGAPVWAIAAALGVAMVTGLLFGVLPARRAAALDPVQALSRR